MKREKHFTELELDALQETMNIAFGSAAADLAEMMDIFINLNIPTIKVINVEFLMDYIKSIITDFEDCNIIIQKYHGEFEGEAFLIFPYGMEKEILSYFQSPETISYESDELIELEREALMEIGNILTGACIGKIFEMLNSNITYLPPQAMLGKQFKEVFKANSYHIRDIAITMETSFSFEDRNITGYLFLLNYEDSISHLKKALAPFQE